MPHVIIGLVGRIGSGKGTAATILKEKYGAEIFRFSSILGDIANRLAIEISRDNLVKLSEVLRSGFGEDVLAYAIENDVLQSRHEIVVVDGIRRIEDIVALEPLPQFKLIEVAAPAKVRFDRLRNRGEKSGESGMTWEAFCAEEEFSTERTIPAVAARAWKAISNAGDEDALLKEVDAMMAELKVKPV